MNALLVDKRNDGSHDRRGCGGAITTIEHSVKNTHDARAVSGDIWVAPGGLGVVVSTIPSPESVSLYRGG
jgi:hypothetical protein